MITGAQGMVLIMDTIHSIEIAIFQVLCDKISFSGYLHSHGVIAEDDKTDQSGSNAETITSQNSLADGSSTGDAADEKTVLPHTIPSSMPSNKWSSSVGSLRFSEDP